MREGRGLFARSPWGAIDEARLFNFQVGGRGKGSEFKGVALLCADLLAIKGFTATNSDSVCGVGMRGGEGGGFFK